MAELLYRLGRLAARRPRTVLAAWAAVLALAAAAFALGAGTLAGGISIPGTPTAKVTERLEAELPEVSGGTGTVVLTTLTGEPFTAEQKAALAERIAAAARIEGVAAVVDPFAVEAQRAAQEQQVADGSAQVDQGRAQLEAGQAELDAARAQAEAAGALALVGPELDAQQEALDAGAAELEAQAAQLAAGRILLDIAREIRTVSADGDTALATVMFEGTAFEVGDETKAAVMETFGQSPAPGVVADFSATIAAEIPDILGLGELIGVLIAAILLLVVLGTLLAAGLPILNAVLGVGIGALLTLALSGAVEMVSVTPVLGVMLGLGVGIDYSLFILNRHRWQLRRGEDLVESIGLANGTAGNAVVFAGTTVLIALLALNVAGIPFLGLMGNVAAISIAVAVLIAVTMTPAVLALLGHRVLGARDRARLAAAKAAPRPPSVATPMSTRRALAGVLLGVVVLVLLAIPAASLRLGLPDGSSEAPSSTQYRAYRTIAAEFGPGRDATLLVVADLPAPATEPAGGAAQFALAHALSRQDGVVAVAPIGTSDDGMVAALQVVPAEGAMSESTADLVDELRSLEDLSGVPFEVAGQTSGAIDVSAKLASALPLYLAVVVGLSLLILMVVFRSLLLPVVATLGFVLSFSAVVGAVVAIYQWGWLGAVFDVHAPGPVLNFLPTVLVGVLFGLAMDYMLFIGSGIREAHAHGAPARVAVAQGVRAGRAVVAAAALIMASVFGGFIFAESAMIRPIGFALAFGVIVDAFVVRMFLVPAVLHLVGDGAWWLPRWLDRLLPDVDVEGAALARRHPRPVGEAVADEALLGAGARPAP